MKEVTLPIIIDAKGDILFFESLHEAEAKMEPIDVQNKEFIVFDSRGLVLIPRVHPDGLHAFLEASSPPEYRPDQLREILRQVLSYLVNQGILETVQDEQVWRMDIDEMIAIQRTLWQGYKERKAKLGWRWYWPWAGQK